MKKLILVSALLLITLKSMAATYKLQMVGLNAWISKASGNLKISNLSLDTGLVITKFTNMDYNLFTREKYLVIDGVNQSFSLDLGHFKKVFEEQNVRVENSYADIITGKSMSVGASFFQFESSGQVISFNEVIINCSQPNTRSVGDEIIALCLTKGGLIAKSVDLGKSFVEAFPEITPLEIKEKIEKESLRSINSIKPKIYDLKLAIKDKAYKLNVALKAIFKFKLKVDGDISHDAVEDLLTIKIKSAKWWKISFKKLLLKVLKKLDVDGLEVKGESLVINLAMLN